jgi:hypothetical protein
MATTLAPGSGSPLLSVILPLNDDVVAPCPKIITDKNKNISIENKRLY